MGLATMRQEAEQILDTHFLQVKFDDAEPLNVEVKEIYCIPHEDDEERGAVWVLPDFEKMGRKPFLDIKGCWRRFLEANGEDQVFAHIGSRDPEHLSVDPADGDIYWGTYWADGFLGRAPSQPPIARNDSDQDEEWWIIEGELHSGPFVGEWSEPIGG